MKNNNTYIVLDTNFLMLPHSKKVDIFSAIKELMDYKNIEFITFSPVVNELKKISSSRDKHSTAATVGLELIKKEKTTIIKADNLYADDAITNSFKLIEAKKENIYVATIDKSLKKRVKETGMRIITLRSHSKLIIL